MKNLFSVLSSARRSPVRPQNPAFTMKTTASFLPAPRLACWLLLAALGAVPVVRAQTGAPPELMSYQGSLVDTTGTPLGNSAPKNYDVIFRIYDAATSGNLIYSERQIVTVDKGYFSVLLGQGATVTPEPKPAFSSVFQSATSSDRYIGIAVVGINGGSSELAIEPRLRLLPSAYAFLAKNANALANAAGNQIVTLTGANVGVNKTGAATALDVNGTVTATTFSGSGSALTGLNAANISAGAISVDRIPSLDASKIGGGTLADVRLSANVATLSAGQTFTGDKTFNGGFVANGPSYFNGGGTFGKETVFNAKSTFNYDYTFSGTNFYFDNGNARLIMNGRPIWLRGLGDDNHALYHSGGFGVFSGAYGIDGPVLTGFSSGILGFKDGGATAVLKWNRQGIDISGQDATDADQNTAWRKAQQLTIRDRNFWSGNSSARLTLGMSHKPGAEIAGVIQAYWSANTTDAYANGNLANLRLNPLGGTVFAGSLNVSSDRNTKQDFKPVDYKEVLAKVVGMPVTTWVFTNSTKITHMGPVAQDFNAAFNLGDDDKSIGVTDANGVALAAIKGLNTVVEEKNAEIKDLKRELSELRALVEGLARQNGANRQ